MAYSSIRKIEAREILDSRGEPTVEVDVVLSDETRGRAAVPSGASTGSDEALELRDGDRRRYGGKGVTKAVKNVTTTIAKALKRKNAHDQKAIDEQLIELDGTPNKSKLGANAILGVSLAVLRAAAASEHVPLYRYIRDLTSNATDREYPMPIPILNVFNGGKHADTNLDFQELWVIPHHALTFKENLRHGSEIFHALSGVLTEHGLDTDIGNEGGYAPNISASTEALDFIVDAIRKAGLKPGNHVWMGIDAGANTFYDASNDIYRIEVDQARFTSKELVDLYAKWVETYPIALIEDGLHEEDWDGWKEMTDRFHDRLTIIGDDLFVTNVKRLQKGIDMGVANGVLIKPNQIGTVTETLACVSLAKENDYRVIVSHRSGETADTTIADIAVAVKADFIKAGSVTRGERVAKYNRLMEIEHELEN